MKNLVLILSAFLVMLTSCKKVISLDLNDNTPKIVIEAAVNADSLTHYVTLTKSINFDLDVPPPVVTDATITIKEENSNNEGKYLFDAQLGKYVLTNFLVKEGKTYYLTVVSEGQTYTASSTVPMRVKLDSLKVAKYPSYGGNYAYTVVPLRHDPAGISNYYQFLLKKNNKLLPGIYVEDDLGMDGQATLKPIFPNKDGFSPDTLIGGVNKWTIKEGNNLVFYDSILVDMEMLCIENKVYRYFLTLALNQGKQQNATPSNPDALFTNGALGYFSAQTSQKRSIYITNK